MASSWHLTNLDHQTKRCSDKKDKFKAVYKTDDTLTNNAIET